VEGDVIDSHWRAGGPPVGPLLSTGDSRYSL
jgi:hypothetical protein